MQFLNDQCDNIVRKDTGNGCLELLQAHRARYYSRVSTSFPKNEQKH